MAGYTQNLNLEKPYGNENFRRLVINNNMDKLDTAISAHLADKTAHGIGGGVKTNLNLNWGYNNIKHTGETAVYPTIQFRGASVVNLLGKDGNCETMTFVNKYSAVLSLDTTNKCYGKSSLKATKNGAFSVFGTINSYSLDTNKKYFARVKIMGDLGNVPNNIAFRERFTIGKNIWTDVNSTEVYTGIPSDILTSNIWKDYGFKFVPKSTDNFNVGFALNNLTINIDGVMITEITADEYNNLTVDQLLAKYPYVDSYVALQNPYFEVRRGNLVRNGNCEEGTGWWIPDNSYTKLSVVNSKLRVTTTAGGYGAWQAIQVKPNTDYYIKANIGANGILYIQNTWGGTTIRTGVGMFNSGTNTSIVVSLAQSANGTSDFDSIMLIEGTTAPTAYIPCDLQRFVVEGQFTQDDTVKVENGRVTGQKWWMHRTLYGKDYDWQFSYDMTGFKAIGNIKFQNVLARNGILIKYDGKVVINKGTDAGTNSDEHNGIHPEGSFVVTIADADSGWAETINPNNDEVKAFMNGWKALDVQNNRYTVWVSIVDGTPPAGAVQTTAIGQATGLAYVDVAAGTGSKFTQGDIIILKLSDGTWVSRVISSISVDRLSFTGVLPQAVTSGAYIVKEDSGTINTSLLQWCKSNIAPNYEGYQLHYKLTNPEPIDFAIKQWALNKGDNYVYVDSGMVLGEVANTDRSDGGTYYGINTIISAGWLKNNYLCNKTEDISCVYKNLVPDYKWIKYTDAAYGNMRAVIESQYFDPTATYTVDYQILKTLHAQQFSSLTMEYAQSIASAVTGMGKALEQKQPKSDVLDRLVDLSVYEEIGCRTYSWYHSPSGGVLYINFIFNIFPKICTPILTIRKADIYSSGMNLSTPYMTSIFSEYKNLWVIRYAYTDTAQINQIKSYGIDASMQVVFDCRGRL